MEYCSEPVPPERSFGPDQRLPSELSNGEQTMVNENVGSVLHGLVKNNVRVGQQAVGGYRAATEYLIERLDAGFKSLHDSAPKVRIHGKAQRAVGAAGGRVTGYCGKVFERLSDTAETIVGRAGEQASNGIDKVAARVSKVGNAGAARYAGFANTVSLRPLKLARDVSAWVATRAESRLAPRAVKRSPAKRTRPAGKSSKKTRRAA
jgi:hypothetical protein